jgi:hypothetical protein
MDTVRSKTGFPEVELVSNFEDILSCISDSLNDKPFDVGLIDDLNDLEYRFNWLEEKLNGLRGCLSNLQCLADMRVRKD